MNKENLIGYQKTVGYLNGLKTFRRFTLLTRDQRKEIREAVDLLEDTTRSVSTKVGSLQEEYKELKSHKQYTEEGDKLKKLLRDCDKDITAATDKFSFDLGKVKLIDIKGLFNKCKDDDDDTKNEKAGFWPLYTELEGVFLKDDGGEPVKGGG
mgnify:CR=1 FL=1